MPKRLKQVVGAIAALLLFAFVAPNIERKQDATVGDAAITKTCWDRHGFDFVSRWQCRSALHQVGAIAFAMSCVSNKKKSDLCENLEKIKTQQGEDK